MAVSQEDWKEYEQGKQDSSRGLFDTFFHDIIVNHPDSPAYYEGRENRELDDDKNNGSKK